MQKSYAAYEICPTEIAIFENEEARADWLAYNDLNGDDSGLERVGLTDIEARLLAGEALDDESQYIADEFNPKVRWLILHNADDFNLRDYLLDNVRDVKTELALAKAGIKL